MRKPLSIFLLVIFTFNWFGYRFVAQFLEETANKKMQIALDNEKYDESQLISIRIPADYLSYANNNRDFERVDGHIEMNGIQYNFVKWRVYDGILEFLCLPNFTATKLEKTSADIFKLVNDLQNGGQNKKSNPFSNITKNLSVEYEVGTDFVPIVICVRNQKKRIDNSSDIPTNFPSAIDYPPENHC